MASQSGRRGRERPDPAAAAAAAGEEELPVYLARPGTTDQVPRQKYGGMFCNVEGAFESKTLDFGALNVGQRGARRAPSREQEPQKQQKQQQQQSPVEATPKEPPAGGIEIRPPSGKQRLQNLSHEDYKVRGAEEGSSPGGLGEGWRRRRRVDGWVALEAWLKAGGGTRRGERRRPTPDARGDARAVCRGVKPALPGDVD